jgi:hypothetical protein
MAVRSKDERKAGEKPQVRQHSPALLQSRVGVVISVKNANLSIDARPGLYQALTAIISQ